LSSPTVIQTPLPIDTTGPQRLEEVFATLHRAFPDLHIAIEALIEDGDKVVSRNTVTGDQGEYMDIPPTGKSVMYNEIFILRFTGRRIAETWGRRRLLPDESARRDSRVANLTESAQEDRHSKFYELSDTSRGSRDGQARHPLTRRRMARLLAGVPVLISARLAIPPGQQRRAQGRPWLVKGICICLSSPRCSLSHLRRDWVVHLRHAVGIGQWR
jgi:hypothetical protein